MNLSNLFKQEESYIIEMRRWFHQYPELSLKEYETSKKIKEELCKMGISFEEIPPNTGIIATIEGKSKGKTIAVRADIDALPVAEETNLPFTSKNEGVMHACGHDAHIAMLLGAAKVLNQVKDNLNGTVKIIFQSAEEIGLGYREILDYIANNGGIDEIIGLHIWSALPEGEILLIPKPVFAGACGLSCKVRGKGGHGARPDLVRDPIKAACELVTSFSSIPMNFHDVFDTCVVTTCMFNSGTLGNIFPDEATFKGTFRYFKNGNDVILKDTLRRIADGVALKHQVEIEVSYDGAVPPVKNNAAMVERARALVSNGNVDGLKVSEQVDPICASDNFGYMLEKYNGFYGILGAGSLDKENYPQHNAKFDLDENSFRKGSQFMVEYVCDYLK